MKLYFSIFTIVFFSLIGNASELSVLKKRLADANWEIADLGHIRHKSPAEQLELTRHLHQRSQILHVLDQYERMHHEGAPNLEWQALYHNLLQELDQDNAAASQSSWVWTALKCVAGAIFCLAPAYGIARAMGRAQDSSLGSVNLPSCRVPPQGAFTDLNAVLDRYDPEYGARNTNAQKFANIVLASQRLDAAMIQEVIAIATSNVGLQENDSIEAITTILRWSNGHEEVLRLIQLLLDNGVDPDLIARSTDALIGSPEENLEVLELLLDYGADYVHVFKNAFRLRVLEATPARLTTFLNRIDVLPPQIHESVNGRLAQWVIENGFDATVAVWKILLAKGLPIDPLSFPHLRTPKVYDFIKEVLLSSAHIDLNSPNKKGYSLFEASFALGDLELIESLASRGGKTERPVVLVVTDFRRQGIMYRRAEDGLLGNDLIPFTLTLPFEKARPAYDAIRELKGRPMELLKSGVKEVDDAILVVKRALNVADAIWISGGAHVWAGWYDEKHGERPQDLARDMLEIIVVLLQKESVYKPLFAVCRGIQLVNVVYGGSLANRGEQGDELPLTTEISDRGILGTGFPITASGYSNHEQSIDRLADNFEVVATSNGMIKAIQSKDLEVPIMATQFHPEADNWGSNRFPTSAHVMGRFVELVKASKDQNCFAVN